MTPVFDIRPKNREAGFTLIEILITMVIASIILAGLLTNFVTENKEFKYQNKRIDAVQDLEFAIKFIADDLRGALIDGTDTNTTPVITVTDDAGTDPATTDLYFTKWALDVDDWASATAQTTNNYRAVRHYEFDSANKSLKFDRNTIPTDSPTEILPNVTFFKIFTDGVTARGSFSDIPSALSTLALVDPEDEPVVVSGYTILIEIEVDSTYDEGVLQDVFGNATSQKRVWRYLQVHPQTIVE